MTWPADYVFQVHDPPMNLGLSLSRAGGGSSAAPARRTERAAARNSSSSTPRG